MLFLAAGSGSRIRISNADPDRDPGRNFNADACGSVYETLDIVGKFLHVKRFSRIEKIRYIYIINPLDQNWGSKSEFKRIRTF